jgi:Domain of unknown function (DUF5710)
MSEYKHRNYLTEYVPKPAMHRINLNVPFSDKDQARAVGAKWDGKMKTWYIPPDANVDKFRNWLPKE